MTAPQNGNARRQFWVSVSGVGVTVLGLFIGAIWWLSSLQGTLNEQQKALVQEKADRAEAVSQFNRRIGRLEKDNGELKTENARLHESLNEIETQFCAGDIVRNLMHANEMRDQAVLWEKTFGIRKPTDNAYYPVICNRKQ